MSSTLQQIIASIWLNDYTTLIILTAIGYDYLLTLSDEVEYIWTKPWTQVSTLFILARYFGLSSVAIYVVLGSTFLPGPAKVSNVLDVFGAWAATIFVCAADLAMILRVWALYGRSKLILGVLLTFSSAEIIAYLIGSIMISVQKEPLEATVQVLDFSFCVENHGSSILPEIIDATQITLGALMCLLFVIQFIREAFQMYKATSRFSLNRYMNLLIREGVIYFLVTLMYSLINALLFSGYLSTDGWRVVLIGSVQSIPPFTLVPRFILSLRKLFVRDVRGRRGSEIDTAFGLSSGSGRGTAASRIVFADVRLDEGADEEIQMAEREVRGVGGAD